MGRFSLNRARLKDGRAPLLFSAHTTAAAMAALALAELAQFHHPWWAAMTVWLVAQPSRGLLIERCLARLAGTAVGALVAGALLYCFFDSPKTLLILLGIWLVLCAGIGNLFRHFRNYAWVLAGYSAAIVSLFGLAAPQPNPELATERVACTVIGILCSFAVSWLVTPKSTSAVPMEEQLERLVNTGIRWCMSSFSVSGAESDACLSRILGMIKALDESFDMTVAGSRSGKRKALHARQIIDALIVVLAVIHERTKDREPALWIIEFDHRRPGAENLAALIECVQRTSLRNVEHHQCLTALLALHDALKGERKPVSGWTRAVNHDWRAAGLSAVRPLSALTITALIWQLTGWGEGPVMMMTSVLFASLLSSHPNARKAVKDVFTGSLLGGCTGLIARAWLVPGSENPLLQLLSIAPFLLVGAFFMARPGTAKMAIDLNMTFLLMSQPGAALDSSLESLLPQAMAILLGVLAAAASLLLCQQTHPENTRLALARRIAQQTLKAARSTRPTSAYRRTRHLLVSLVLIDGTPDDLVKAAFSCMAATAPYCQEGIFQAPTILEKASNEARAAAQKLIALTTHSSP
ncbi:FUSC family protein [Pseudomonas sp. NPDC089734]|uniref:FUSC family protein n=1 Tax=Pseudomonas sp. NPDC089734 TaxID=3364469 RepID=UPI00380ADCB1